jgi:PKHD-type hydroxylase
MQLVNFLDSKVPEDEPRYKINPVPRDQGTIIVFPSTMLHRVSPITKGIRRSVVGWAMGPPLR